MNTVREWPERFVPEGAVDIDDWFSRIRRSSNITSQRGREEVLRFRKKHRRGREGSQSWREHLTVLRTRLDSV